MCSLRLTDKMNVQLHGSETMTEGEATAIRCSADHTCRSSPPTIQWNKPRGVTQKSVEISRGSWREESILTYIPTYVDDGNHRQCTATYPNGEKTEKSIKMTIKHAPKNLIVTIIGKDEVKEGSDVTLQCNSVSNPNVSEYEWYKGKEKSRLQYTGREIIVRRVTRNTEAYSCTAINTVGRGESALTDLPIVYAPKQVTVTVIGEKEVMEGSDVTLQCSSNSKPDVYKYEWYKGKKKTKLTHTEREITVKNVTWNMEPYSCTAINTKGRGESALMEIPVLYRPKNVTVTIIGKAEVMEGSDVTLQCNSVSNPNVYKYEWYKGKEKSKLQYTGREIIVRRVTGNMEAYSCTAINTKGRGESAPKEITVLYAPKNVTVMGLIGKDEVMEGSDVTLQCNSVSNPDVSAYEWYKGKEKSRLQDTGREIIAHNVTWDMEPYSCAAINRVGRGESALTQIPVPYKGFIITNIVLSSTIGPICLLMLGLLVYYYWRKRSQASNETETSPDATYANLVKKDIENHWE